MTAKKDRTETEPVSRYQLLNQSDAFNILYTNMLRKKAPNGYHREVSEKAQNVKEDCLEFPYYLFGKANQSYYPPARGNLMTSACK